MPIRAALHSPLRNRRIEESSGETTPLRLARNFRPTVYQPSSASSRRLVAERVVGWRSSRGAPPLRVGAVERLSAIPPRRAVAVFRPLVDRSRAQVPRSAGMPSALDKRSACAEYGTLNPRAPLEMSLFATSALNANVIEGDPSVSDPLCISGASFQRRDSI